MYTIIGKLHNKEEKGEICSFGMNRYGEELCNNGRMDIVGGKRMLEELDQVDRTKVFYYFEEISKIPRGSGNNTGISNYLVSFAKQHGLRVQQDEYENVIIWKAASAGNETKPTVILQGHMDMVCEKEADCVHDFQKDPLDLQIDGDYVYAKGTTLGGDDGIAVAYALAILDDDTLVHPPLEVVITTDEETGMDGAIGLDTSALQGTYFINIDSEEEGTILTSCAGGMSVNGTFPYRRIKTEGYVIELSICGLQGGHSGTEIDKNRESAVLLAGRILTELKHRKISYSLLELQGGQKDNAIPREAKVRFLVKTVDGIEDAILEITEMLKKELACSEPQVSFQFSVSEKTQVGVIEKEVTDKLVFFLEQAPFGVQKMSAAIPGLVESSLNLGICKTTEEEVFFSFSVRSSKKSYKDYVGKKLQDLIEILGGTFEKKSEYPAWEYRADSDLRDIMTEVYQQQYGKKPAIEAIHAGLECGILADKMPQLDMVSIGPDILDIHTPKERLVISSTRRVYQYIVTVLENICNR